jgi:metal-responsive CopG/Arc/MetJ family transcriptional regulator
MPADYYRVDLRLPASWLIELDKLRAEVLEKSSKKVSRTELIRAILEEYLDKPSSYCKQEAKRT